MIGQGGNEGASRYKIHKVVPPGQKRDPIPKHLQHEFFPGFLTTTMIAGQPGSGKTNLLVYMLTHTEFYKGFFNEIWYFGPTFLSDELYQSIEIPKDKVVTDIEEMLPRLKDLLKKQQAAIEAGWNEAPKLLIVFEDLTSLFNKIQKKPEFIRCYCQIRHLKASSIAMVHKYKAFERTCRMCALHVICFKMNNTEIKQLYEDFGSSYLTLKEFFQVANFCVRKTEKEKHPFFYINLMADEAKRYRRCFDTILEFRDAKPNQRKDPAMVSPKRKLDVITEEQAKKDKYSKFMEEIEKENNCGIF